VSIAIYSPPPVVTPIIINNNNVVVNPGNDDRGVEDDRPILRDERFFAIRPRKGRMEAEAEPPAKPMPGEPAGGFRKLDPKERIRPDAPAARNPPPPVMERPKPERPFADPDEEAARQIGVARQAFEAGEYGLAERRLEQALRVQPKAAEALFLLAQAQFALAKFREAVESIEAGLRLQPDWPGARFRVRDLYAGNNDEFDDQHKRLKDTLERNPNDFFLLFLNGYVLWFDGKQDAARVFFRWSLKAAPESDRPFINRFLLHGQPVVQR
jgi:tetratricopeptide (TPR) repeat protein